MVCMISQILGSLKSFVILAVLGSLVTFISFTHIQLRYASRANIYVLFKTPGTSSNHGQPPYDNLHSVSRYLTTLRQFNHTTGTPQHNRSFLNAETKLYYDKFAVHFELNLEKEAPDRYLNEHKYIFTRYLEPSICRGDVFMVTLVHTAVSYFDRRDRIRKTWGSVRNNVTKIAGPVFLVGQMSPANQEVQDKLEEEMKLYGDVLQGDFVDAYKNMTYKSIMGLHWVRQYCRHAKFVLKTDDDVLVDVFRLIPLLKTFPNITNFLYCTYFPRMKPFRNPRSKFGLSSEAYPLSIFPPYCRGWFYVMPNDVAAKIYDASTTVRFFWIDDVLVTGALTLKAGLKIRNCPLKRNLHNVTDIGPKTAIFYLAFPIQAVSYWDSSWDVIRSNNHDKTYHTLILPRSHIGNNSSVH